MSARTRYFLLAVVLIIAIFLRFYHFMETPPGLYPDEAIDGNNAAEVAQTGHFQTFYIEDNGREGLYVNTIAILLKYFNAPHEAWVIRLPAMASGVLTVLGMYLLVAELFGSSFGLLAAFFLATSFWHINFSRIGFRAIMAPLLLTWALYLFIRAVRSAASRRAIWLAALGGVVYALGFYTYIAYRVTPLLFLLFIPFFKARPGFWKRTFVFIIAAFLVAAPIGWYFAKHPADFFGRTAQIAVTNAGSPARDFAVNVGETLLMFNGRGDGNWRHNVSDAPELFWPVGLLFLIGIAASAWAVRKNWRKREGTSDIFQLPLFSVLLMSAWFVLALLPAALSDEGIPHALRSILMLPPAITFAAIGGIWLYRFCAAHMRSRGAKETFCVLIILFFTWITIFAYVDYFIVWAQNPNVPGSFNADYVTIGREINALPVATPKYVIIEARGVPIRGLPTPVETTMFITDTFTSSTMAAKNVHYLLPEEVSKIPSGTPSSTIFSIK